VGADAILLAVTLLATGVLLTYPGKRLVGTVGIKRPVKTISVFMILIRALSSATFPNAYTTMAYSYTNRTCSPLRPQTRLVRSRSSDARKTNRTHTEAWFWTQHRSGRARTQYFADTGDCTAADMERTLQDCNPLEFRDQL
jgi:hypothetical protein